MIDVRKETLSGVQWNLLKKLTLQPLQFIYGMVLARLIAPDEMGILGLTAIFFALAAQIKDCGFSAALIRKIDRTEQDINTVFWTSCTLNALMAIVLFVCAPLFASFFNQPALTNLTRVSAGMMFLESASAVHWTLYEARRDFKTPAIVSAICALISMPVVIVFALLGFSYWSVVFGGITASLVNLSVVLVISPWRPRLMFSKDSFREFFSFGIKLLLSGSLNTVYEHLRVFIIGKFYNPSALALFSRAHHLSQLGPNTITGILGSVTYPILAQLQNDMRRLFAVYQKYMQISSIAVVFACLLLSSIAEPLIPLLYGSNWAACTPYVQVMSLSLVTAHATLLNYRLLIVLGHTGLILKLEIMFKLIGLTGIAIGAMISVYALCWAMVIGSILMLILCMIASSRRLALPIRGQLRTLAPYYLYASLACAPAFALNYTPLHNALQSGLGIISAVALYWVFMHKRRDAAYTEILSVITQHKLYLRLKKRITRRGA